MIKKSPFLGLIKLSKLKNQIIFQGFKNPPLGFTVIYWKF